MHNSFFLRIFAGQKNKFMKKIITLVAIFAFATTAFSQITFHGGGNISHFRGADIGSLDGSKFGYQIGITTYSNRLFSIQPGVFLTNKGASDGNNTVSLNYLQVPVNAMLGYNIDEDWRVIVGVGLYGALGLFGRMQNDDRINFFNQNRDPYRMLDFGWQFVLGTHWGRWGARIVYQPGFWRVTNGREGNAYTGDSRRVFNTSFMFGISYTLGGEIR